MCVCVCTHIHVGLVYNIILLLYTFRSQRLMFDVTSPKGVLLFREASKTIVTFGQCAMTMEELPDTKVYERK